MSSTPTLHYIVHKKDFTDLTPIQTLQIGNGGSYQFQVKLCSSLTAKSYSTLKRRRRRDIIFSVSDLRDWSNIIFHAW
jgi:hypothetical protein